MRVKLMSSVILLALSVGVLAAESSLQATASMSELMTRIIQPTSDAVFYVSRFPPEDDAAWLEMENKTLMLAESANLLLVPGYAQDSDQWLRDTLLMRNAAVAAWGAAKARDMDALMDLNGALYESCESCHNATR
ncbi:hypothetical protein [Pseudohongiella sp.]|uniref:Cytochrome c domain-containing protein n=1 Tax=marine sediment metagenome TaxID=412755 RepID=A0A0F9YJK7_9ZZZZ|nr:hypothetical protein [Pseudohongiella sp.]HDZ07598.1 hypothetical protein [Pseudohongiella sp.]HEA63602.1 hypothetical protein [Pseudohongiella sp.]